MLNTTVNSALRIIRTVFLYSDVDELSVVYCNVHLQCLKVQPVFIYIPTTILRTTENLHRVLFRNNFTDLGSNVIFSGVLNLSCLVNKEWTMYCCEQ